METTSELQGKILYEYRSSQKRIGAPKLYPREDFSGLAGFISVFGFSEQAAEFINTTGSTRDVGQFPLFSNLLYLDFDNNTEAEDRAIKILMDEGLQFTTYHTGGRGRHIHIPILPISRRGLNHYFKLVVTNMFPGADDSIYKTTGVIRIPGSFHSGTGIKMTHLNTYSGAIMDIDRYRPKGYIPVPVVKEEVDEDLLNYWLSKAVTTPINEGDRNNHGFYIASTCKQLELDKDQAEKLLNHWNGSYCSPPMRDRELFSIMNSAYRR